MVSDDLVSDEFRKYLQSEENAPYLVDGARKVQVTASLRFSNSAFRFSLPPSLLIARKQKIPDEFWGDILVRAFMDTEDLHEF